MPKNLKKRIKELDEATLSLAEQYIPLMLDGMNPKILYCLLCAEEKNARIYDTKIIAKLIESENSQELVDRILHLEGYALVYREDRLYKLTDMGKSATNFVDFLTRPVQIKIHQKKYEGLQPKLNDLAKRLATIDLKKIRENVEWYAKQN